MVRGAITKSKAVVVQMVLMFILSLVLMFILTCFLWEQQYFELDLFRDPAEGLVLLEIELDDIDQPVSLPPFLEIDREVTDDPAFLNSELARMEP